MVTPRVEAATRKRGAERTAKRWRRRTASTLEMLGRSQLAASPVEKPYKSAFYVTYTLSALSSCTAEAVTFPFDIIKTRLQAQGESGPRPGVTYRGLVATGVGIVQEEGFRRLYRGLVPACLRHCVYSGIRVGVYEFLREHVFLKDADGRFPLWKGIACGMMAGAIGQFFASPTDLVKVQLQLDGKLIAAGQPPRYTGTIDAFTTLAKQGGVKGLWKGWVPNCQRAALVQLGDLTTYDAAKQFLLREVGVKDGPILHALSSAVAGLVAATLGAPADVIKTRYMNQPTSPHGVGLLYSSSLDCLKKTVGAEGFRALYKGWLPTWLRMAPWSLTFFLSFEQLRRVTGQSSF